MQTKDILDKGAARKKERARPQRRFMAVVKEHMAGKTKRDSRDGVRWRQMIQVTMTGSC